MKKLTRKTEKQLIGEYNRLDNAISKNVKRMIRIEGDLDSCETQEECNELDKQFKKIDNETDKLESKKMEILNLVKKKQQKNVK